MVAIAGVLSETTGRVASTASSVDVVSIKEFSLVTSTLLATLATLTGPSAGRGVTRAVSFMERDKVLRISCASRTILSEPTLAPAANEPTATNSNIKMAPIRLRRRGRVLYGRSAAVSRYSHTWWIDGMAGGDVGRRPCLFEIPGQHCSPIGLSGQLRPAAESLSARWKASRFVSTRRELLSNESIFSKGSGILIDIPPKGMRERHVEKRTNSPEWGLLTRHIKHNKLRRHAKRIEAKYQFNSQPPVVGLWGRMSFSGKWLSLLAALGLSTPLVPSRRWFKMFDLSASPAPIESQE